MLDCQSTISQKGSFDYHSIDTSTKMDRFNQMTGQADLIAKKKLEIEAKLKLQKEAAQNSGSIAIYNQLAASSNNTSPAETSSSNQRRKKALPIGNLKNRWGFKGKSVTESERYFSPDA